MSPSRAEQLYQEQMSQEALDRQREAARLIFPCCGWRRDQGHHPMCVNTPKERERT